MPCFKVFSLVFLNLLLIHCWQAAPVPQDDERIENYENYFNEIDIESENADEQMRNALSSPFTRWPGPEVYYKIGDDLSPEEAENIRAALQVFNEKTCLKFLPYGVEQPMDLHIPFGKRPFIDYKRSPNQCGTRAGYNPLNPTGSHLVLMNPFCLTKIGVIQHETLHVLGLLHEQSRPDRDKYVQIDYDNIDKKYWSQFTSYSEPYITTYDVPYDYESVMHYSQFAFAKNPTQPSIRAREGDKLVDRKMGRLDGPSEGDLRKVNIMYNCN